MKSSIGTSARRVTLAAAAALACGAGLISAPVLADNDGAGCGLGQQVLDGKSGKGANIAAAILNAIVPNTFFMTTGGGIMGCDPTQTVEVEQTRKVFVASNFDQLSTEAARGQGQYLEVLGALMGVPTENSETFAALAQREYDLLFGKAATGDAPTDDAERLIDSLELAMAGDESLQGYSLR